MLAGMKLTNFMISDDTKQTCRIEFERHFGQATDVRADFIGQEEIVIVENKTKRVVYNSQGELIKVINLIGEE